MMKRFFATLFMMVSVLTVLAQGTAEITFDKTSHNFGAFLKKSEGYL